jgi:glycopeptide antibiotics resistance protein
MYKLILYRFMLNIFQMFKVFVLALPLSVTGMIVTIVLIKQHQKRTGIISNRKKRNAIVLLVPYVIMMLQVAILLRPFGSIKVIDLIPFNMYGGTRYIVLYAVANAVIFFPVGILLPVIWEKMNSLKMILLAGFLFSLFIELSQLAFQCGMCQTEDLLMNTLGAGVGYLIYKKQTLHNSQK